MNKARLKKDLTALSYAYLVAVDECTDNIIIKNFNLPPGYNMDCIPVLLKLPRDYPCSPPGVGDSKVYVPQGLKYRGRKPDDYHEGRDPEGWAWWCYERIDWDPHKDDLISFFELFRAHMTKPERDFYEKESSFENILNRFSFLREIPFVFRKQ